MKLFRKCRKNKIRKFQQNLIQKLELLHEENPKAYWELLDKLKQDDKEKSSDVSNIDIKDWYEYFKDLSTDNPQNKNDEKFVKKFNQIKDENIFNELDKKISTSEIVKAIKSLKNGKASGFSKVSNEIIKYSQTYMIPILYKLFNLFLALAVTLTLGD